MERIIAQFIHETCVIFLRALLECLGRLKTPRYGRVVTSDTTHLALLQSFVISNLSFILFLFFFQPVLPTICDRPIGPIFYSEIHDRFFCIFFFQSSSSTFLACTSIRRFLSGRIFLTQLNSTFA